MVVHLETEKFNPTGTKLGLKYVFLDKLNPKFKGSQNKRCRLFFFFLSGWARGIEKKLTVTNNCLIFQLPKISLCSISHISILDLYFIEWAYEKVETLNIYALWSCGKSPKYHQSAHPVVHHIFLEVIKDWTKYMRGFFIYYYIETNNICI